MIRSWLIVVPVPGLHPFTFGDDGVQVHEKAAPVTFEDNATKIVCPEHMFMELGFRIAVATG